MLFHPVKKFVFISTPKTGTTSIEDHITSVDPDTWLNNMPDETGAPRRVRKHITARHARDLLGDRAREFTFIAFIRDPAETALSKYFYYRQGEPYQKWQAGRTRFFHPNKNWYKPTLVHKVLLARALSPTLWARVYPLKLNHHFLVDADGTLLVDQIGSYERLQDDFTRIFSHFGYEISALQLPVRNVTTYRKAPPQTEAMRRIIQQRRPEDFDLFSKLKTDIS